MQARSSNGKVHMLKAGNLQQKWSIPGVITVSWCLIRNKEEYCYFKQYNVYRNQYFIRTTPSHSSEYTSFCNIVIYQDQINK